MARPIRINWPGAFYHITDRGNDRQAIFRDDQDRERFCKCLEKAQKKHSLLVHAFCLMPNHYHLAIETPKGNLSNALQWLKTTHTVNFNRRHHRVGHLFQGRFKAILVEKENHLLELTRYIHLNPVRAGLVALPEEYIWSSYLDYIHAVKKREWLMTEETLSRFGNRGKQKRDNYRRFVEEGLSGELENPLNQTTASIVLGSDTFIKWLDTLLTELGQGKSENAQCNKKIHTHSIESIIETVGRIMNVSIKIIRFRGQPDNSARELAIYLAQKHGAETNAALGRQFGGITGSGVSYTCRKVEQERHRNRNLRHLLEKIEQELVT